ncbi:hypothetical protein COU37_03195 [Candidatus Micrarchaeota archaeon CG10_big_fil_rev_8_21_14_0_10_45_29]|nr:MAG: hypothetical protein COU37_03195 [Candidatus Micrarchaeota archaeon CG10_big_fil_rev_8_21_14_0_10_45_29]QBM01584.1 hypothetical protein [uncultured archaeon]
MAKNRPLCIKYALRPQKPVKKTLATLISILSAVAFSIFIFSSLIVSLLGVHPTIGGILLLTGICAILIYAYEKTYFGRYFYSLEKSHLVIKKGVFTYGETTIPLSRIQDVYVDQDILDQLFGLYDLHVSTASGQSSINAHIDGLSYEGSQAIKNMLLQKLRK